MLLGGALVRWDPSCRDCISLSVLAHVLLHTSAASQSGTFLDMPPNPLDCMHGSETACMAEIDHAQRDMLRGMPENLCPIC